LPTSRRREAIFHLPDGVRPYQDQPVCSASDILCRRLSRIDKRGRRYGQWA
jgi:hypothetical protein